MFFGIAAVHAVQHLRPVLGLCAAGTRMNRKDAVVLIKFARKKGFDTLTVITLLECGKLG